MPVSARMLACIVAGLVATSHAPAARAQTAADIMERWGLLGTWAVDCKRPPAINNTYLSYVKSGGGKVLHERNFGNRRDSREVLSATVSPEGRIEVTADFGRGGGMRRWSLARVPDGRIRTMASSRVDGTGATIRDGRFVSGGRSSPWMRRCDGRAGSYQEVHAWCPGAVGGRLACPGSPA
jgi:hypothetical protein